jgi:two-component system sensor histidine kinase CreC
MKDIRSGKKTNIPENLFKGDMMELYHSFEELRDTLEGKKYIESYVQNLTHELKSPLTSLIGASELLQENLNQDQVKKFASNINYESNRLKQIVENLLQLSSVETRKSLKKTEPVDIISILENLISLRGNLPLEKKFKIESKYQKKYNWEDKLIIPGNKFLLEQAIHNVIQNAVDFVNDGGIIIIDIIKHDVIPETKVKKEILKSKQYSVHKNPLKTIEIQIINSGRQIPQFALDEGKVFDRFFSMERENKKKSTGLGLAFVREVVKLHHGKIKISNHKLDGNRSDSHGRDAVKCIIELRAY